jgi:ABC-type multidrug transport system fused ATPase/permease subunit
VDYTGTIKIDGVDTSNIPKSLLRSHITTISQDAVQLAGSIRQNLLPYDGQACDGRMDDTLLLRTLKRVGLSESISSKGGLSASLSDMSLSEGQMQFLCLARALLHNYWVGGKVVLMDEPTSNMDHETDARIQTLVNEFFANCTVLMITHRPDAIVGVDRRLEVSNGQVSWGSTTLAADAVDS